MWRRCLSALVFVLATAAVAASPAVASTLTVNTTFDDTSPFDGLCSLREAIAAVDSPGSQDGACAPAAFGPNTIVLGPKLYTLFSPNRVLSVASTVRDLTITGAGEHQTTIDATNLDDRVLQIAPGASVTISTLTISGGHAQAGAQGDNATTGTAGTGGPGDNGGGILNQGTLTVLDAAVSNNEAGAGGAGGSGFASDSSTDPAVIGGAGGPGGQGGGIFNTGTLTLTGATLTGNQGGAGGAGGEGGENKVSSPSGAGGAGGTGGAGGGVTNAGGSLTVSGTTINGNVSGIGGGGALGGPASSAPGGSGGAGGNGGAGADGGGIWNSGGDLSITNSTIASNTAGAGGAAGSGGLGNTNSGGSGGSGGGGGNGGNGGGIAADASATLSNVTLAGDRGGQGGAGGSGGSGSPNGSAGGSGTGGATGGALGEGAATLTLQNSLLDLNVGNCGGSVSDGGHNLSFGDSTCPASFLSSDPELGALQNNGGPSETIGLQSGSVAIGQGASCPPTDQRGVPRSTPKCDIGAYEVAAPVAVTGPGISISSNGAVITATVTPNSGNTIVDFEYAKKKGSGFVTAVAHLDGVTAVTVKAKLTGLKPSTVYHYRVVATSADGSGTGALRSFTTIGKPAIWALRLTPRTLKTSAAITYKDSRRATTTLAVLRCVKHARNRCRRYRQVRSFRHKDVVGRNRARLDAHGLARGAYKLDATPQAGKLKGKTVAVTFLVRQ
jgi:CSLREA domain-containing protein